MRFTLLARIAANPQMLKADIISPPDDFELAAFTKEVKTLAYDMTSFRLLTDISVSPTFFGWVFGFGGKVQILAPEEVKEQYKQMIKRAAEE